jgi:hypothetical protein
MDKSKIFLSHRRMFANPNYFKGGDILSEYIDLRASEKVERRGKNIQYFSFPFGASPYRLS